jgi:hypothetical protein
LYGAGTFKGNSYVGMFEEVRGLPYFWSMECEGCPFFVFVFVVVFFVVLILVGFFVLYL